MSSVLFTLFKSSFLQARPTASLQQKWINFNSKFKTTTSSHQDVTTKHERLQSPTITTTTNGIYATFSQHILEVTNIYKTSADRFQKIQTRQDYSQLTHQHIEMQANGCIFITHKGCHLLKTADDLAVIKELLWELKPATVIELGTFTGGTAVWLADTLKHVINVKSHVFSMDHDVSIISEQALSVQPSNLTFLQGDTLLIKKTFPGSLLAQLPHPWLILEDTQTNITEILTHFHDYMMKGDYFIIEDINPAAPRTLGHTRIFPNYPLQPAGKTSLACLREFLTEYSNFYSVDSFYTDFFGYNATWNMHGYIKRMI